MKKKLLFGIFFLSFLLINIISIFKTNDNETSLISLIQTAHADTESGGGWFYTDQISVLNCGSQTWTKTEYYDDYWDVVGLYYIEGGVVQSEYKGTYSYVITTSGVTPPRLLNLTQCPDGWDPFCSPCLDPCKGC